MFASLRQLFALITVVHLIPPRPPPLASLYRAVKRDAPAQVDVLFEPRSAKIAALDTDFQAVELDQEVEWDEARSVVINQVSHRPIVFSPDKLWLESLQDVSVGDAVLQPKRIGKLEHVFPSFHRVLVVYVVCTCQRSSFSMGSNPWNSQLPVLAALSCHLLPYMLQSFVPLPKSKKKHRSNRIRWRQPP